MPEYDPGAKLKTAVTVIFGAAILTVIGALGVAAAQTFRSGGHTSELQFGIYLGLAGLLVILGILVRRRMRIALFIACGLNALDAVVTYLAATTSPEPFTANPFWPAEVLRQAFLNVPSSILFVSVGIHAIGLYFMFQGFKGLNTRDSDVA